MSSVVHVLAIIVPAPGKIERVKEILTGLAEKVKTNEPGVLKYHFFEQVGSDSENVIAVQEIYKDQATFDSHMKTDYFTALGKTFVEENLVSAPLDIKFIKPFAGHESR